MVRIRRIVKYLLLPVVCWLLSACGMEECLDNSSNCDFGKAFATSGLFTGINVPPLPSISSMNADQYKTMTVMINANISGWTSTNVNLNKGDKVTIQVYPSGSNPTGGDQLLANGTISTCYNPNNCLFSNDTQDQNHSYVSQARLEGCTFNYIANSASMLLLSMDYTQHNQSIRVCSFENLQFNCNSALPQCSSGGFGDTDSYDCIGNNGQGLSTEYYTSTSPQTSKVFTQFQDQFMSSPGLYPIDPSSSVFINNAVLYKVPASEMITRFTPNIPWKLYPNPFTKWFPGYYDQNISSNYNLYSVLSGCFGVNGVMDMPQLNANDGMLQYFVGSEKPLPGSRNTFVSSEYNFTATTFDSPQDGALYLQIYEDCSACGSGTNCCYNDNIGQYQVQIITKVPYKDTFLDTITSTVINALQNQVNFISKTFYSNIVSAPNFTSIINAALVLYVVFYGISFTLGFLMITQKELVTRVCKMGVVLALIHPGSWGFFNTYLFNAFTEGLPYLASIAGGGDGTVQTLFLFADQATEYLTSVAVWIRILTFMMLYPIGYYFFIMILYAVTSYAIALLEAFLSYLIALTAIAFFISMGPLFIILILFNYTRSIFDNWIKLLGALILQPVILFSCIAVVNELVLNALNNILMDSQYRCVVPLFFDLGIVNLDIVCFTVMIPNPNDVLMLLCLSLVLMILVQLLKRLPEFVESTANFLGGPGAAGITNVTAKVRDSIINSPKAFLGMDQASKARRTIYNARTTQANKNIATDVVPPPTTPPLPRP